MLVLDMATDVLRQITVISEIETPSAEQGADFVTKLNGLMASLLEDGIDFGYNPKATTAESLELPLGQIDTIKALVGIKVAGGYGEACTIPPEMALTAQAGYQRLIRRAILGTMRETSSNAPRGEHHGGGLNIVTGN